MRVLLRRHGSRSTSRAGSNRPLRGLVAALLIVGSLATAAITAAAQADETYRGTADGLEWSVSWDGGIWEETDTGDAADLVLTGGDSTVTFLADTLYGGNATDCVDGELANVLAPPDVEDSEPIDATDLDLGEQDGNSRVYAGYSVTSLDEDGDEQEFATTVLCQTVTPDESVLIAYHVVPLTGLADDAATVSDLLANIVIGPSDEPDPTEEPSDGDEPTGADGDAGTYASPTYGYGLSWEASDWEVETDETVRTLGRDRLTLVSSDSATRVFYEGSEEWDGDLDDCVGGLVDELVNDVESNDPIELASGDIITGIEEIDDPLTGDPFQTNDQMASAGYTYNLEFEDGSDQDQFIIVDCIVLDEGSGLLLGVSQVGLADDLGNDVRGRVVDVTGSLIYDGEPVETGSALINEVASRGAEGLRVQMHLTPRTV